MVETRGPVALIIASIAIHIASKLLLRAKVCLDLPRMNFATMIKAPKRCHCLHPKRY